ncbi:MAG: polyprenyl synthetase family protein [Bacteroidota bacterium]
MKSGHLQNFDKIYDRERRKIEKKISGLFTGQQPESLYAPCSYIMQAGGKRLRPLLVLISANAVSGKFSAAYNAAAAVELLHNFTLVHDDIMDNACKRRGRDTVHIKFDLSTAILTGDNLIAIAYNMLLKDCKDNDKDILSTFTKGIIEVCEGQSLDKEFEMRKDVSIEEYLVMIKKKTAALLEICCSLGGKISGGTKQQIRALESFGINLGMAFQIHDDLLDIEADEAEFGKTIGGDLIEGKKTFLFLKALETARGKDKQMLLNVIKNKGISKEEVPSYRDLYNKLGVIGDTKKEIAGYTRRALRSIEKTFGSEEIGFFVWLANSLLKRNK